MKVNQTRSNSNVPIDLDELEDELSFYKDDFAAVTEVKYDELSISDLEESHFLETIGQLIRDVRKVKANVVRP